MPFANDPPPSRRDNPFATCWTKPGAMPFRFPEGKTTEQLVAKLAAQEWWGQIMGTHGSGKTTLLATLIPALTAAGRQVHQIRLHNEARRLVCEAKKIQCGRMLEAVSKPSPFGRGKGEGALVGAELPSPQPSPEGRGGVLKRLLIVVDGFEQLGRFERLRLKRRCRRAGAGLLVTAHVSTGLPTLIHLSPERRLIEQLVADLCAQVPSDITRDDIAASHASHGSNVREIFFDLYDRHERLRRVIRTVASEPP